MEMVRKTQGKPLHRGVRTARTLSASVCWSRGEEMRKVARPRAIAMEQEARHGARWLRPRRASLPTTQQQVHRRRLRRSQAAHQPLKPSNEGLVRSKRPSIHATRGARREVAGRRMPASMRPSASNLLLLNPRAALLTLELAVEMVEPDLRPKVSYEEDLVPAWCQVLSQMKPMHRRVRPAGTLAASQWRGGEQRCPGAAPCGGEHTRKRALVARSRTERGRARAH